MMAQTLAEARENEDRMERAAFHRQAAEGLDWSELECRNSIFQSCRFTGCDFTGAAFWGCSFQDCLFSACRFPASFWRQSSLVECKGDGCDFRRARFRECRLEKCLLRYGNFSESRWDGSRITDCDMTEAVLSESRIRRTAFLRADFTGAELFRTSFRDMDLSSCTLDGITLSESCAELKGAKINAAQAAVVARILGIEVLP